MIKTIKKLLSTLIVISIVLCAFSVFSSRSVYADSNGIQGFVERLYEVVLDRSYDVPGRDNWIRLLSTKEKNGAEVAKGFFFSEEIEKAGISNEEFLNRLYRTFMDREADTNGKSYWMNYFNNGATRLDVFNGFVNSVEWANICADYGIISGGSSIARGKIGDFVERIYTIALGRASDTTGKADWTNQIVNGTRTASEVAYGFFFSEEFVGANLPNDEYVERLYGVFFNRPGDTAGKTNWVNQLNAGASRESVFNGFANSQEWGEYCAIYGIVQGYSMYEGNVAPTTPTTPTITQPKSYPGFTYDNGWYRCTSCDVSMYEEDIATHVCLIYSDTPTNWTCGNNTVSEYNIPGIGTIYGYWYDSGMCAQINQYRSDNGLNTIPDIGASYAYQHAASAAYNLAIGKNMHANDQNLSTCACIYTGGGFQDFLNSDPHKATFDGRNESPDAEHPVLRSAMASATFVYCYWDGYLWMSDSAATAVVYY